LKISTLVIYLIPFFIKKSKKTDRCDRAKFIIFNEVNATEPYFQYNVYGIDGAAITSGNGVNSTKIDLSNVSKGIYFFEVKNAAGTRSIKIIKE